MEPEEKIVTLATYYDPMLAEIIRTRLEDNGIPCAVDNSMQSTYPVYTNALGGIKVKVFEQDMERAKAILAEDASLPVEKTIETDDQQVVCPFCGSNNVRYSVVRDDKNWFTKIFSSVANALPLGKDKDWHCFNCGKDFE